jgi:hypothetical protein
VDSILGCREVAVKPQGKVAGPVRRQYYVKWMDSSYRNCQWILDAQAYRLTRERVRKFDRVNRFEPNVKPQVHAEWSQVPFYPSLAHTPPTHKL